MEERQITIDGITHKMPTPFHVLATQNPIEYEGTFPLPETQLDRFVLRISLGYPSASDEITIIENQQYSHPIEHLKQVATSADVESLQTAVKNIYVDNLIKQYITSLVEGTRNHPSIYLGASHRGSLALFRTAQAYALVQGRDYVLPDDVKTLAGSVLAHRLIIRLTGGSQDKSGKAAVDELLEMVPVPGTVVG
jgi:MoxR-like ATPase